VIREPVRATPTSPAALLLPSGIGLLLRANQPPDDTDSAVPLARSLPPQRRRRAGYAFATHSAVLPRVADGCIAGMMREPNRARLTSDAALLLR
jgi:hypothetical protein